MSGIGRLPTHVDGAGAEHPEEDPYEGLTEDQIDYLNDPTKMSDAVRAQLRAEGLLEDPHEEPVRLGKRQDSPVAQLRQRLGFVAKHQGPGPHKKTGTPQSAHRGKNEPANEPLKPRETTGTYAGTGGTSEATAWVRRAVRTAGGFTVNRMTGDMPKEGIAVAHPPEHSLILSLSDLSDSKKVDRWLKKKRAMLAQPNTYLGGWLNKADRKVYIDVVEVFPPSARDQALKAGRDRNQLAVFDLGSFEEIPTGGTGKVEKASGDKPELLLAPGDIEAEELTEILRRMLDEDE